jgi:protein-disulfide isomerase
MEAAEAPSGHTPGGGVLVGRDGARRRLVVFEDPQCPYCREFELASGDLLRREVAAGAVAVEYRIRSFLGNESVRAASAGYIAAVREGRYESWVREIETVFGEQDPDGTPFGVLDGRPVDSETLYDPDRLGALIRD